MTKFKAKQNNRYVSGYMRFSNRVGGRQKDLFYSNIYHEIIRLGRYLRTFYFHIIWHTYIPLAITNERHQPYFASWVNITTYFCMYL